MKTTAGLWIDHKKAIIVFLTSEGEEIKLIKSFLEKPQQSTADDARQREWTEDLSEYYDEVISFLRNAEAILILGPGEAKGELKKRFEHSPLKDSEIMVETAGRLTENQVAAKVRQHFQKRSAAAG